MKKFIALICMLNAVLTASVFAKDAALFLADPFILEDNNVFYIYGTSAKNGIVVYKSNDLKVWEGPCGATNGLAMHRGDSWGEENYWAPEVYKINGKYLMTYSAEEHIVHAWADSPMGPFKNKSISPYLDEKGIDSHIFVDDDGKPYMFWVRFDGGNVIYKADMSKDFKSVKLNTAKRIIAVQKGTWEKTNSEPVANVAEGSFVIKHNNTYYLSYSCNHFRSPDYAVGYATAPSIKGPWTRYKGNPILANKGGYRGTGHHSFLKTQSGEYYMVYHAHNTQTKVDPRRTLISPMRFKKTTDGAPDILEISDEIITPVVRK